VLYKKKWPVQSHYKALERGYRHLQLMGFQFKLAHLHVSWPSGIAFQGFLKTLPYVITEHYSGYQKSRRHEWSRLAQHMARRIMIKAQVVCPVSNQLANSLEEFGISSHLKIVGNVVNTKIFNYQEIRTSDSKFRLLHISSLQQETKNIKGILCGFKKALERDTGLHLSIGGDGDIEWLKKQIEAHQIPAANIEILSALSREEVALEMSRSHAFLLFSFIENQPVVLLESLCLGRPVIASKVGGIPEFIGADQGILVESQNEEALAEAILQLKEDFSNFDLQEISNTAQAQYSYSAIAEEFLQLYLSVRPSIASGHPDPNLAPQ
tara:strand:+ start:742 stop:1713 length:972 start_codon:yes stop_codon:yes gene_type:complete